MFGRSAVQKLRRRASPCFCLLVAYAFLTCVTVPVDGAVSEDATPRAAPVKTRFNPRVEMCPVEFSEEQAVAEKTSQSRNAASGAASRLEKRRSYSGLHDRVDNRQTCEPATSSRQRSRLSDETRVEDHRPPRRRPPDGRSMLRPLGDDEMESKRTHRSCTSENDSNVPFWTVIRERPSLLTKDVLPIRTSSASTKNTSVHFYGISTEKGGQKEGPLNGGQVERDENSDVRSHQQATGGNVNAQFEDRKQREERRVVLEQRVHKEVPMAVGQAKVLMAQYGENIQNFHSAPREDRVKEEKKVTAGEDTLEEVKDAWAKSRQGDSLSSAVRRGEVAHDKISQELPCGATQFPSIVVNANPFKRRPSSLNRPKTRVFRLTEILGTLTLKNKKPRRTPPSIFAAPRRDSRKKTSKSITGKDRNAQYPSRTYDTSTRLRPTPSMTHFPAQSSSSFSQVDDEARSATRKRVIKWFWNSRHPPEEMRLPRDKSAVRSAAAATPQASTIIDIPEDSSICAGVRAQQKRANTFASEVVSLKGRDDSQLDSESSEAGESKSHLVAGAPPATPDCFGSVSLWETKKRRVARERGRQDLKSARAFVPHADVLWDLTRVNTPVTTLQRATKTFVPLRMPAANKARDELLRRHTQVQPRRSGNSSSENYSGGGAAVVTGESWDQVKSVLRGVGEGLIIGRPHRRAMRNKWYYSQKLQSIRVSPPANVSGTLQSEVLQSEKHRGDDRDRHRVVTSPLTQYDTDCTSANSSVTDLGPVDTENRLRKEIPLSPHTACNITDDGGCDPLVDGRTSERHSPADKTSQSHNLDISGMLSRLSFRERSASRRNGEAKVDQLDRSVSRRSGIHVAVQPAKGLSKRPAPYEEEKMESYQSVVVDSIQDLRMKSKEGKVKAKKRIACSLNKGLGALSASPSLMPARSHLTTVRSAAASDGRENNLPISGRTDGKSTATFESARAGLLTAAFAEEEENEGNADDEKCTHILFGTTSELTGASDDAGLQDDLDLSAEQEHLRKLFGGRLSFRSPRDDDLCSTSEAVGHPRFRGIRRLQRILRRYFHWLSLWWWTCAVIHLPSSAAVDDNDSVGVVSTDSVFTLSRDDVESKYKTTQRNNQRENYGDEENPLTHTRNDEKQGIRSRVEEAKVDKEV